MNNINKYINEKLKLTRNIKSFDYFIPKTIEELDDYVNKQKEKATDQHGMIGTRSNPVDLSFIDFSVLLEQDSDKISWYFEETNINCLNASNWKMKSNKHFTLDHLFAESELRYLNVQDWEISGQNINMCALFAKNYYLTDIEGLETWDISNVQRITSMFNNCQKIETLDLSSWDVSHIERARSVFAECTALKELNLSGWDVTHIEKTTRMFKNCESLETIKGIEQWRLTKCIDFDSMFSGCIKLKANLENLSTATNEGSNVFDNTKNLKPSWYIEKEE